MDCSIQHIIPNLKLSQIHLINVTNYNLCDISRKKCSALVLDLMSIAYDILFPMHNVLYFTKHYPLFILYHGKLFISS